MALYTSYYTRQLALRPEAVRPVEEAEGERTVQKAVPRRTVDYAADYLNWAEVSAGRLGGLGWPGQGWAGQHAPAPAPEFFRGCSREGREAQAAQQEAAPHRVTLLASPPHPALPGSSGRALPV